MATLLKEMTVDELVAKILAGERIFSGIRLPPNSNLSGHDGFQEMQKYL